MFGALTFVCLVVGMMRPRTLGEWLVTVFLAVPLLATAGGLIFAGYLLWDCFGPEQRRKDEEIVKRRRSALPDDLAPPLSPVEAGSPSSTEGGSQRSLQGRKWWLRPWRSAHISQHYSLRQPEHGHYRGVQ
jgi:hypothetical protein